MRRNTPMRTPARLHVPAPRFTACVLSLALFATAGCERSRDTSARDAEALRTALARTAPPPFASQTERDKKIWNQTRKFYALRQNQPAWIVAGERLPAVQTLTTLLATA